MRMICEWVWFVFGFWWCTWESASFGGGELPGDCASCVKVLCVWKQSFLLLFSLSSLSLFLIWQAAAGFVLNTSVCWRFDGGLLVLFTMIYVHTLSFLGSLVGHC